MNILALAPLVSVGGSVVLSWLLTFVLIAAIVWFVVWIGTKLAGPPVIPEPMRWVVWCLIIIALLVFLFAALGIHLP